MWNRAGTALYYRDVLGQIVDREVTTGATFSIGERRVVVTGDFLTDASHASYDVAPDDRKLGCHPSSRIALSLLTAPSSSATL